MSPCAVPDESSRHGSLDLRRLLTLQSKTFYLSVAAGGISFLAAVFIPWLSVKKETPQEDQTQEKPSIELGVLRPEAETTV
jgi:hypothetical protein